MDSFDPDEVYRLIRQLGGSATQEELAEFWKDVIYGECRSSAILAQSLLENCVTRALAMLMPRQDKHVMQLIGDDEKSGELSFSYQCKLLYAIGVIGPNTLSDFLTLARIRNKFGHTARKLTFGTPSIADACESLWAPDNLTLPLKITRIEYPAQSRLTNARGRYLHAINLGAHGLAYELLKRPEYTRSYVPTWLR